MKKFNLFLIFFMTTSRLVLGQMDINAVNKPVELLNSANEDIENGNYTDAVQKLLAAIRLEPKIREMYLSLNTACSHTNQISILKQYLIKAKAIFEEDDEICYYLGNIYQNENNFQKAIAEYSLAIKYAQKNGEDFGLVYAYYQNRASCYLKINECSKSIPDFTYALKLNPDNGAAKLALTGEADSGEIELSGASKANLENFVLKNLALATSGASNASVNVTETLEVEASGAAHVSYSGNPKVTSHVSGAASLKQR